MKYRIWNLVINADHIIHVDYLPDTPDETIPEERASACGIKTTNPINDDRVYNIWLRGDKADAFWKAYNGDAYRVV